MGRRRRHDGEVAHACILHEAVRHLGCQAFLEDGLARHAGLLCCLVKGGELGLGALPAFVRFAGGEPFGDAKRDEGAGHLHMRLA